MKSSAGAVVAPGILTWIWLGCIVLLSTIHVPEGRDPGIFPHTDKVVHAGMYCVLAVVWLWEKGQAGSAGFKPLAAIAGLMFLFGLGMEGVQILLPHRSFAAGDIVANAVGIAGGISLYLAIYRYWQGDKK